jgi:hypothetical protein
VSDQRAVEALAVRRGRDLADEGVTVVAMDGATNIAKFLERYGPSGAGVKIAGLYDVGEEGVFQRALGVVAVEELIAAQGELDAFRTMQKQPAHRDGNNGAQLRRFMGTNSGRKIFYAPVLVDALDLSRVPLPLDRVLGHV